MAQATTTPPSKTRAESARQEKPFTPPKHLTRQSVVKKERFDDTDKRSGAAASAGWVAVVLNVVPGLGAGYLYQRRWKAYWITSLLATTWFVVGAVLAQNSAAEAEPQNQLIGLIGLIALAAVTSAEAGLAVKAVRQSS